jgi:hypothetical protein
MSGPECPSCDGTGSVEGPDAGWYELPCRVCGGDGVSPPVERREPTGETTYRWGPRQRGCDICSRHGFDHCTVDAMRLERDGALARCEKLKAEYVALAGVQSNALLALQTEVKRLKAENDELQDDLLTMLKVRNEALRQAACEVIVGPDGQDDLDRARLISKWVREGYEELGISEPDWAWVPTVEPKPSLVAWAAPSDPVLLDGEPCAVCDLYGHRTSDHVGMRQADGQDRLGSASREGGGASSAAVPTPAPGPSPSPARFEMLCLEDDAEHEHVCYRPFCHEGPHQHECDHPSASGVDQAPSGPDKVWRCDVCGWLYRSIPVDGGRRHRTVAAGDE